MCSDIVTPEQRSKNMSNIRWHDTKPELKVRSVCHALGFRFRLNRNDLPGKPDLVFPKHRLCLFVHGCFWHCHLNCNNAHTPKSNIEYWSKKLSDNVKRDLRAVENLKKLGWRVITVWECETKNIYSLRLKLEKEIPFPSLTPHK